MLPAPVTQIRVSRHYIPRHGLIPNTSIQSRPLVLYHGVFPDSASASSIEDYLTKVNVVVPQWRYSMYSTTHFHSTAHEVLCVSNGKARLCFGGEDNAQRVEAVMEKVDVMVIPAGVGHRLLDDISGGFEMVGSYIKGSAWDMCYGKDGEAGKVKSIEKLNWFERDPIYGDDGPALANQASTVGLMELHAEDMYKDTKPRNHVKIVESPSEHATSVHYLPGLEGRLSMSCRV